MGAKRWWTRCITNGGCVCVGSMGVIDGFTVRVKDMGTVHGGAVKF